MIAHSVARRWSDSNSPHIDATGANCMVAIPLRLCIEVGRRESRLGRSFEAMHRAIERHLPARRDVPSFRRQIPHGHAKNLLTQFSGGAVRGLVYKFPETGRYVLFSMKYLSVLPYFVTLCPRGDLNPHSPQRELAPQASASAYSATRTHRCEATGELYLLKLGSGSHPGHRLAAG